MLARKTSLVLLTLALAAVACQPAAQQAGLSDADVAAIRGTFESLLEAERASDWDAVATAFTEDAVFMMPDQPSIEGRAAWRASVEEEQWVVHELTADIAEIDGRGDLAYLRGTYSEVVTFGELVEPVEVVGKYLWIMEKQADGSWLCTVAITNSDQPPAE